MAAIGNRDAENDELELRLSRAPRVGVRELLGHPIEPSGPGAPFLPGAVHHYVVSEPQEPAWILTVLPAVSVRNRGVSVPPAAPVVITP